MINFDDLRESTGGQLFGELAADSFSDFCTDWKTVQPGQLYATLNSDTKSGRHYIAEAIEGGASGILCTGPPLDVEVVGTTVLVVEDIETALAAWAKHVLAKFGTTIIVVAGTVGRQSAARGLAAVLQTRYSVLVAEPNMGRTVAVPLTLGTLTPEHDSVLFEVGDGDGGQIPALLTIARPHTVVLTGTNSLNGESHPDRDTVTTELQQLVEAVSEGGSLVLNYDDDGVRELGFSSGKQVITYGLDTSGHGFGADLLAYNIQFFVDKIGFDVRHGNEQLPGHWSPWLGRYQLYGALAAAAAGILFDVPLSESLRSLSAVEQIAGRMRRFEGINGSVLIDDSFGSNLASATAALDFFDMLSDTRRRHVFVLGDVSDTGAVSQDAYRALGRQASRVCDLFVVRGKGAAIAGRAAREAEMAGEQVQMAYGHADVARIVQNFVQRGDIVLVTGAEQARMERVSEQLLAYPERDAHGLSYRHAVASDVAPPVASDLARITSWVELDLDASASNIRKLKDHIGADVTLMAVVKANAYGHGMLEIAGTAIHNGAGYLGVGNLGEALELRMSGIDAPILILGFTPGWATRQAVLNDIAMTVVEAQGARAIDRAAAGLGRLAKIHVKVDSGMGRLGMLPETVPDFFRQLRRYEHLEVEGILTHFSVADSQAHDDLDFTAAQIAIFQQVLDGLTASGFTFRYVHAANSAATIATRASHFSMVRVGLAMHGISPSADVRCPPDFQPVLTWKSTVAQLKTLAPDNSVGYGNTYYTSGMEKIALIPIGYADGIRLAPRNWGEVLIRGQRAPIIGRVSMGMTTINVTHISDVLVGDEVVLIGRQGDDIISAEDVAGQLGTNPYEVVCGIGEHVPRIF